MKNVFAKPIFQKILSAATAFRTFPAAIGNALGFAIVTLIRINLNWEQQLPYNFLFNCLHWSFALGAVFSLAAIAFARSRYEEKKAFILANILGIAVMAVTFFLLYYLSADYSDLNNISIANVSGIASARVSMAILISMIAFIVFAAYPKEKSDFARSLFMTQKAFFIALIYGAILMAGTSAVAGAFQALIYNDMSYKVYEYLGTIVGFFSFTIFVGFFPDFTKGKIDEKREIAQKQPRFVKILFEYIMIPIILALTIVLLSWSAMKIFSGADVLFEQLASISTGFAVGGIWLHIMTTENEVGLAKFYRKIFPFAALLILAFEMWALVVQLGKYGLKETEYIFILLWIVTAVSSVLLIILKQKSHMIIATIICALAVFSVLPVVGYNALPVTCQVSRLENLFESQDMLQENKIVPAKNEPDKAVREDITDAVTYLAYIKDADLPEWFNRAWIDYDTFKSELGFEKTVPQSNDEISKYSGISLVFQEETINISGYQWVVYMQPMDKNGNASSSINGNKGVYTITWIVNQTNGLPSLTVSLNDEVIFEQSMKSYFDKIIAKYPLSQQISKEGSFDDMSLNLETSEMSILLVFENAEISVDNEQDKTNYWLHIKGIYFKEK